MHGGGFHGGGWRGGGGVHGERAGARGAEIHVLDHWTYLGTARSEEDLAALGTREAGFAFDADIYRILMRYFSNHPNPDWHDLRAARGSTLALKPIDVS